MKTLLAILILTAATVAYAEEPWEANTPVEQREAANQLFAEANTLFGRQAQSAALEKYAAAIKLWDHPLIHFNMAVTLVRLDRLVEAEEHFNAALKYGDAPYSPEQYQQLLDYQKLVRGQIGQISVSCTQPDVQVLLDAKPWLTCPGTKTEKLRTGEHLVVGERKGYATESRRVVASAAKNAAIKIELRSLDALATYEYPSPRWIPWTVAGGGAAVILGGVAMWVASREEMDRFEKSYTRECANSCETDLSLHLSLRDQRDSATFKDHVAVAMFTIGGAAAVAGAVWIVLNRPHRVMPSLEVAPGPDGVQAVFTHQF
jgi:hypothetical protein